MAEIKFGEDSRRAAESDCPLPLIGARKGEGKGAIKYKKTSHTTRTLIRRKRLTYTQG